MDIDVIFEYTRISREVGCVDFEEKYLSELEIKANRYKVLKPILQTHAAIWNCLHASKRNTVAILGTRFPHVITAIAKKFPVLVLAQGPRDRIWAQINGYRYVGTEYCFEPLLNAYLTGSHRQKTGVLLMAEKLAQVLVNEQVSLLLTFTDSTFAERYVISSARLAGIRAAVYQHGHLQLAVNSKINDGWFSDYILAWGEYYKNYFVERGIANEAKVRIAGYPWLVDLQRPTGINSVCIVGSAHDIYDKQYGIWVNEILIRAANILAENNYLVYYRPHPRHWSDQFLLRGLHSKVKLERNVSVQQSIRKHGVFIGVDSTVLIEAAIARRVSVQLLSDNFHCDRFSNYGLGIETVHVTEIVRLGDIIRTVTPKRGEDHFCRIWQNEDEMTEDLSSLLYQMVNPP